MQRNDTNFYKFSQMKKEINKKAAFWIIGILITIFVLYLLNLRVCAPCTYQYNDIDYNTTCPEICMSTPKWKIILFNLTGKNIDAEMRMRKPDITKSY